MRIKDVQLAWFRGAADPVSLAPGGKSMVVYGANGAGKSSFVDAIEFVLCNGKISHLTHEYSGRGQKKGILNTHIPKGQKAELRIEFQDGSVLKTEIKPSGSWTSSGAEAVAMTTWEYRGTVLRQADVAKFVTDTKGAKYSALLPLLGLHHLEATAQNLRDLAKSVKDQSGISDTKAHLKQVDKQRKKVFGTKSDDQILALLEGLCSQYPTTGPLAQGLQARCQELGNAIKARINQSSADQQCYSVLRDVASLDLADCIKSVREESGKLADAVEPLIAEKLEILQSTGVYVGKLGDDGEVTCPACGRSIRVDAFRTHVHAEKQRLQGIIGTFEARKTAFGALSDCVRSLGTSLGKTQVRAWRAGVSKGALSQGFALLDRLDLQQLRASCQEQDLAGIESQLIPLIDAAVRASKDAPPEAKQLVADWDAVVTRQSIMAAEADKAAVERAEALISFINSLEQGVRDEIRERSQAVIDEISSDIQAMWQVLHPDEPIEGVCLYLPQDADKAIDIRLTFHGVQQDSPRLTLSEGHRNSLGLCIFLAMAKREANKDRPLFLDDVVVSLDRNHRGMIAELLEAEFSGRQVLILTHDREWYTELRQQLDSKTWTCKVLLPYETPETGIRWSHKTTTFGDARAHLKERPDSAGNDARKIMDVELALIAERLRSRLPYLRADKNDRRMAHEFLDRLVADGKKCLQEQDGDRFVSYTSALGALQKANRLLISWANRGSHSFSVMRSEATKVIDACEQALDCFECSSCGKKIWFSDASGSGWVQCQCGGIRWRYEKA